MGPTPVRASDLVVDGVVPCVGVGAVVGATVGVAVTAAVTMSVPVMNGWMAQ